MERPNPFIAGPPIEDEKRFFGRNALVKHLIRELSDTNKHSFLLYGPRRIGKTTLLRQLEYHLSDEGYTQVYFDLFEKSRLSLKELLFHICQAIADACAFEAPPLEKFDRDGRFFIEAFLPFIEKKEKFGPIVLLFDDFASFKKTDGSTAGTVFLPFLVKHFHLLRNTKIICCLNSHSPHLALISRFDSVLPISRFSRQSLEKMLQESSAPALRWDPEAIDHLWNLTRGHPYLSQMFGNIIWNANFSEGRPSRISRRAVEEVRTIASPYLRKLFESTWRDLSAEEQAFLKLLLNSGNGPFSLEKIYARLGKNGELKRINWILGRFRALDIIEKVDKDRQIIDFSVPLFKDWVIEQNNLKPAEPVAAKVAEMPAAKPVEKPATKAAPQPSAKPQPAEERAAVPSLNNWSEAVKHYEAHLAKNPADKDMRAKLRYARSQEFLANRYKKALSAISNGEFKIAQSLLAEVILREPSYKEASRYLLLATTGIDAKELKQKVESEHEELVRVKSQIKNLQQGIAQPQKSDTQQQATERQIHILKKQLAEAEAKERENNEKLSSARQKIDQLQANRPVSGAPSSQNTLPASTGSTSAPSRAETPESTSLPAQPRAAENEPSASTKRTAENSPSAANLDQSLKMLDSILEVADTAASEASTSAQTTKIPSQQPARAETKAAAPARSTLQQKLENATNERVQQRPDASQATQKAAPKAPPATASRPPGNQAERPVTAAAPSAKLQSQQPAPAERKPVAPKSQPAAQLRSTLQQKLENAANERAQQRPVPSQAAPKTAPKAAPATIAKASGSMPERPVNTAAPSAKTPSPQPARAERNATAPKSQPAAAPRSTMQRKAESAKDVRTQQRPAAAQAAPKTAAPATAARPPHKKAERPVAAKSSSKSATPPQKRRIEERKRPSSTLSFTDTTTIDAGTVEKVPDEKPRLSAKTQDPKRTPSSPKRRTDRASAPKPVSKSPASEPPTKSAYKKSTTQQSSGWRPADFHESVILKRRAVRRAHKRRKIQTGWLAGTLNILPVFIWALWLWYVQPLEWGHGGKFVVLIGSVPAWLAASRFGPSDKEKHIRSFVGLAPIISFAFFAVLITETLRPGIPPLLQGSDLSYLIAGSIYFVLIALFSASSGNVASIVTISNIGGASAAGALFLLGGGSIEATLIFALISSLNLIFNKVDAGSAIGAGLASAIPSGFLLFALTHRTVAESAETMMRASIASVLAYFLTAGIAYLLIALFNKTVAKPRL